MAGFVFPEVMRTMSSGDWLSPEETENTEKIIAELQEEGVLNQNKEFVAEDTKKDTEDTEKNKKS
jgi:hypothetical protein